MLPPGFLQSNSAELHYRYGISHSDTYLRYTTVLKIRINVLELRTVPYCTTDSSTD